MASRKKGKKTKGTTLPLTDFLAPSGQQIVPLKSSNWADEVEEDNDFGHMPSRSSKEPVVLPTAPRAARGPGVDEENIPTNPPYVAYISNLPYDVIEEDLAEFFADMDVSNMRLPKDSNKLRGYGYVEFRDRQSLIDALSMTNTTIKTRRVRIEVSNSSNDDRRGGGGRMGMGRDNRRDGYDDPERTAGDWRRGPRDEPSGNDDRFRSRGGGFDSRDRREDRETSENDSKPGGWRDGERNNSAFGERRGYRDDDKRGFRDDGDHRGGSSFGERRGGFRDEGRRGFRDDNERDSDYSRERPNSTWRSDAPARSLEEPPVARERPKLNLQPRTKPVETIVVTEEAKEEESKIDAPTSAPAAAPSAVPAANIFGAAKPVDTTAREREIEDRLAKASAEKAKTEEGESRGVWTRRNGDGRSDREKERTRPTWRSEEDRGRQMERRHDVREPASGRSEYRGESRGNSGGPPSSRSGPGSYRGDSRSNDSRRPSERDRRSKDREDGGRRERRSKDREDAIPPMPKATDEQTPNFVASNKYSMLHDDVDTDNIDD